jgi:tetratricopeptide (TPR) repeat protein
MKQNNKKSGIPLFAADAASRKSLFQNKWAYPFVLVILFILILSMRLLSDPDLGFHLNAGKWIVENFSFPQKDTFTYTAALNDYVDLHWLFQVFIFIFYKAFSYYGLSVLVGLLSILLAFLILKRNLFFSLPLSISSILLFAGFLIIEPRIVLRPEMFTFIFISWMLLLLDSYFNSGKRNLFWLPVIMLLWCNIHSLFILGFALTGSYFFSIWFRSKKIDRYFTLWMILSVAACFINPYFIKGFTFPLELFSRFDSNNVYNQHIKEFVSFLRLDSFKAKDILFICFAVVTFAGVLLTLRKRKIHEFILLIVFFYLAIISIRNIPLFVIIALPIAGVSLHELKNKIEQLSFAKKSGWIKKTVFVIMIALPIIISARVVTNSYYFSNESYYKTGLGIDVYQQPDNATDFIVSKNIKGKIINSIGFGGWLEWKTSQPVFIDGRLEVMKEGLYNEVVDSWSNGLEKLLIKYKPNLIVYNYLKYNTWTEQIAAIPAWRLIYLDGNSAIFSQDKDTVQLPSVNLSALPEKYNLSNVASNKANTILNAPSSGKFANWIKGFYKKVDYSERNLLNISSFCLQMKAYKTAETFFLEVLRKSTGNNKMEFFALAEIYQQLNDIEKEKICCNRILQFDPGNKTALAYLRNISVNTSDSAISTNTSTNEDEAKLLFNSGNKKFQNGDATGAIKDYDKAIELKPDYYKAYNNRGIIKSSELKKDEEALKDFEKAIEINPEYSDAYLGRGTSKYNLKDFSGACKDWRKASDLGNTQAAEQLKKYCK